MSGKKIGLGDWLAAHGVVELSVDSQRVVPAAPSPPPSPIPTTEDGVPAVGVFTRQCRTCGLHFATVEAHRAHFQSAEHRRRVQQLSSGGSVTGDSSSPEEENSESESESESESDSSESSDSEGKRPERTPQAVLVGADGARCAVWRCVAEALARVDERRAAADPALVLAALADRAAACAAARQHWAVLLCRAGYFAGAVFRAGAVVQHRCFRRYTTRRKQGRAQCSADSDAGRAIHSAGSEIRRHHERRYCELVHETLSAWAALLAPAACALVLVAAPRNSRAARYLFYDGSPLAKGDPRVRRVPVTTRRPTFAEAVSVHNAMWFVQELDPSPSPPPSSSSSLQ